MSMTDEIPELFKPYITHLLVENVEIKPLRWDVPPQPLDHLLTREEASEDLTMFRYLIENAYSGREYWEKAGIDFAKAYATIQQEIDGRETISVEELLRLYAGALTGIHDGHLGLMSEEDWDKAVKLSFWSKYKAYFADVLIAGEHERFTVIYSQVPTLPVGTRFSSQQLTGKLFKTLSPTGHEHYLLGSRSWEQIDSITLH